MGMDAGGGARSFIGGFLQLGLSLSIIIIVAVHLQWVWLFLVPLPPFVPGNYYFTCLLGDDTWERILCNYAYAVGVIGIVLSIAICALAAKPYHSSADAGVAGVGFVWWCVAGIVFTVESSYADNAKSLLPSGLPQNNWRHSIFAMCWAAALCCLISLLLACTMKRHDKEAEFHNVQPPPMVVVQQPPVVVYQQQPPPVVYTQQPQQGVPVYQQQQPQYPQPTPNYAQQPQPQYPPPPPSQYPPVVSYAPPKF